MLGIVPTCAPAPGHRVDEVRTNGGDLLGYHCVCGKVMPLKVICRRCSRVMSMKRATRGHTQCYRCESLHACTRVGCTNQTRGKYCTPDCARQAQRDARAAQRFLLEAAERELWAAGKARCQKGCGHAVKARVTCSCGRAFGRCDWPSARAKAGLARLVSAHKKLHVTAAPPAEG